MNLTPKLLLVQDSVLGDDNTHHQPSCLDLDSSLQTSGLLSLCSLQDFLLFPVPVAYMALVLGLK